MGNCAIPREVISAPRRRIGAIPLAGTLPKQIDIANTDATHHKEAITARAVGTEEESRTIYPKTALSTKMVIVLPINQYRYRAVADTASESSKPNVGGISK